MSPRSGWYSRSRWMETFRPDGKGHVLISDGVNPPDDIEFDEIACDICNADAGAKRKDDSEGRIYVDGTDSLCEPCGLKAETKEFGQVRQTLLTRGWKKDAVEALKAEELREIADNWRLDLAVGLSAADIAERLGWDTVDAAYFAARLLEEVNEHKLAKTLFDWIRAEEGAR